MKIFYGICGEGMGHCGRSLAMIERLMALGHHVTIFTFADALRLLQSSGYTAHEIAGLQFRQKGCGAVDPWRTARGFGEYLLRRRKSLDEIRQLALHERPDLMITDFEPLTALAAASLGIDCVSIDNQHRFCHPLGAEFPWSLRAYARLAGSFVRRWIKHPSKCIVAVFHDCPISRHYQHVNVLLRTRIAQLTPTNGEHVLVYARAGLGRRIAQTAAQLPGTRFLVYGCEGPPVENLLYRPTSGEQFARDLASCRAVICSGGQQLIGESRYFGKPLLVIPIPGQHEQEINAHYARQERIGDWCAIRELSRERVERFLSEHYGERREANGVDQAMNLMGIGHG